MSVTVTGVGLFNESEFQRWAEKKRQAVFKAIRKGMFDAKPRMEDAVAAEVRSGLNLRKPGLAKSFRGFVRYQDESRAPVMAISSKVPWLSVHVTGGTVGPRKAQGLMIPINTKALKSGSNRIGRKAWQKIIQQLAAQGNLHFVKRKGKVLVLAETAGSGNALRRHQTRIGADRYGKKKSVEVPIAVMVPRVNLRRRLRLAGMASGPLKDMLNAAIARRMQNI